MNISDEAVEAAQSAFAQAPSIASREQITLTAQEAANREQMKLALAASALHLMADAWGAGYSRGTADGRWNLSTPNPYRSAGAGE